MATELAKRVWKAMKAAEAHEPLLQCVDDPDNRFEWPGQSNRSLWPQADISGRLSTGEVFIVEIDDHADPVHSIVKYWPILHGGRLRIAFVEVSRPNRTFGAGHQELARFIGQRFKEIYGKQFRAHFVPLEDEEPENIREKILRELRQEGVGMANQ